MRTLLLFFCLLAVPSIGLASGMMRVQQADGSIQEYPNAKIEYVKNVRTLTVTTADGKGTLTIDQAACSYVGKLLRCYPSRVTLTQGGATRDLDFDYGTIYANTTTEDVKLPASTQGVPPNGIVMALRSKAGTYLTMVGTMDGEAK